MDSRFLRGQQQDADLLDAEQERRDDAHQPWPGKRSLSGTLSQSAGASLPGELRGRLESSLGEDLSGVRVHTDNAAANAARTLQANAFTIGQAVYFGAGTWDPGSAAGQRLIAHEVAHTVQQRGASETPQLDSLEVSSPEDAHEVEAEAFAQDFATGKAAKTQVSPVSRGVVSRAVIQRDPTPMQAPPMDVAAISSQEPNASDMVGGARTAIQNARARGGTQAVVAEVQSMRGQASGAAAAAVEQAVNAECSTEEKDAIGGRSSAPASQPASQPAPQAAGGAAASQPAGGAAASQPAGGAAASQPAGGAAASQPAGGAAASQPAGGAAASQPAGGAAASQPAGGAAASQPAGDAAGGGAASQPAGGGAASQPAGGGAASQPAGGGAAQQPAGGGAAQQPAGGGAAQQPAGGGAAQQPAQAVPDAPTMDSGGRALIEAELSFHDNWAALSQSGAGGRAAHLLRGLVYAGGDNGVASGVWNSDLAQGARGALVQTAAGQLIKAAASRIPVPGLGNIIGGALSAYSLFSNGGAGIRQMTSSITSGIGGAFSAQNWRESPWQTAADLVAGIKSVLDLIGNVCNILSGLAYAFAAIAAVGGLLSVFFPPLAFLLPYIPTAINFGRACGGIATVCMTVSNLISPIPPLLRAIHIIFSSNDPIRLAAQERTYHSEIQGAIANYGNAAMDRAIDGKGFNPLSQFGEGISGGVSTYRSAMGGGVAPTAGNFRQGVQNTEQALGMSSDRLGAASMAAGAGHTDMAQQTGRDYFSPTRQAAQTQIGERQAEKQQDRLDHAQNNRDYVAGRNETLQNRAEANPTPRNERLANNSAATLARHDAGVATQQTATGQAQARAEIPTGMQAGGPGGEVGNTVEGAYQTVAGAHAQGESDSAAGAFARERQAQAQANGGAAPEPEIERNERGHVQLPGPPGRLNEIDALDGRIEELRGAIPQQRQLTAAAQQVQQQAGQQAATITGVQQSMQQHAQTNQARSQAEQGRIAGQTTNMQSQTQQAQGQAGSGTQQASSPLSGIAGSARTVHGLLMRIPSNRFFDVSGAQRATGRFVEGMDMITGGGPQQQAAQQQTNAAVQERTTQVADAQQTNAQANTDAAGLTSRMGADAGTARAVQGQAAGQVAATQQHTQTLEQQLADATSQRQQKWSALLGWAVQHRQIRGTVLGADQV